MKAIQMHDYGDAGVLRVDELPVPQPGAGQVLVRTVAVGVNQVDWKLRGGHARFMFDPPLPLILGSEAAGVVEAVGEGVTDFKVGDEVIVHTGIWGAYAEYLAVDTGCCALKPANISFDQAGNVAMSVQTAWGAVVDGAQPKPGEVMVIIGAAGAVGRAVVQVACSMGADVYGVASSRNSEKLSALGAKPIAYDAPGGPRFPEADIVLDLVGMDAAGPAVDRLKPGGKYVSAVGPMDIEALKARGFNASFYGLGIDAARLRKTVEQVANGTIQMDDPLVFSFAEVGKAHDLSETGHAPSRIIIKP